MMKKFWLFFVLFLGLFSGALAKPLIIGMELAYPPFEMSDKNGVPTGISVDLAKELGKSLGREIIIEDMSYGGLIPSLKTKKIDIILSSMSITESRKKSVSFSVPYASSHLAILAGISSGIESSEDLNSNKKKLAVKKGTSGHTVAQKYFPKAKLLVFEKESACMLEVAQGKVDAFIYDPLTVYKFWEKNQETTTPLFERFEEKAQPWAIAYGKKDEKLGEQINEFLIEFKNTGGFDKLSEKYLKNEKEFFESKNIPFFFD
ncbi:transporter substrate-binding domain-containing protein [uncultured Cetobacterium sp.]|uniref:transporter substrate-binding domain-containing protein n=1 Tax=uncultured Cetobacterium sp. TaxID=527638 RepID=UPI0026031C7E|nr:transporter substrate-binding domain-containing protein [uncultured Cetobacterium sp.]